MRFLTRLVLSLPADCSQKDLQKLQTTSTWIYDRISGLPEEAGAVPQHRASDGLIPSPTTAAAFAPAPPVRRAASAASPRGLPEEHHGPVFPFGPEQRGASPHQRAVFPGSVSGHAARTPQPLLPGLEEMPAGPAAAAAPDVIYQAVRQAALVYARAIMLRRPLRDQRVCSGEDFVRLWTTVWRVPLRAWKGLLGVFVWVVISVTPASRATPHERFVKNCLEIGLVQMGLENWEVAEKGMEGALRLMRWLACRDGRAEGDDDGPVGQGT